MRRKILIGLSVLAAVLCTLYSCIQEDFASQEAASQRNAAEFFKHSKTLGANARAGTDYVEILEAYNEEYNFLAQMPDQQGMPIWEKMQVIDAEETIGLMIPLSHDNETLSSVLFATLDARYSVTGVKDYDNELLENIVYNAKISKDFREQMLYTFMYIDNKTFGTEQFTGIPADLFVGKKYDDRYGRIWLKDFGSPQTVHAESSKILYIETCGSSWSCKNHESWSKCDHCASCYTTSCGITIIWISDDTGFPPATGTGGGGGGTGGGGSTTPGPAQPPTDPCSLSVQAFYRLKPGCLDSGNPDLPELDNPCKIAKPFITKANEILHSTEGENMDATLRGKAGALKEWAVAVGQKPNNTYEITPAIEQNAIDGTVPVSLLGNPYIGDGHSHPGTDRGVPSGGDLFKMIISMKYSNPGLRYRFVYGTDSGVPEMYALVITDPALAIAFLDQFPESENYDPQTHTIKEGSKLGDEFYKAKKHASEGKVENISDEIYEPRAIGLAYVLDKYNAGISIAKADANGKLKKINANVQQITVPYSGGAIKEGVKVSKCP